MLIYEQPEMYYRVIELGRMRIIVVEGEIRIYSHSWAVRCREWKM